jgi:hypothetical protein
MIQQTWFGKILCKLGVHQLVTATFYHPESGIPTFLQGGCVRCGGCVQWDF